MTTATFHTAPAGWHAIATDRGRGPTVVPLVGWLVEVTPGSDGWDRNPQSQTDPTAFAHPVVLDPGGPPTRAMTGSIGYGLEVLEVVPPGGDLDDALAAAVGEHERTTTPVGPEPQ